MAGCSRRLLSVALAKSNGCSVCTTHRLQRLDTAVKDWLQYRVRQSIVLTHSVKLSDFTVWSHTWRKKNWVNCAVLTGNSADLRTVISSRHSHTELRSSLRESHSFLSLPADTTMASSQGTPFLSINSADEHRTMYSFPNTTSYSTFYAFFSSFRITLRSMWLANSKRQPWFLTHHSHTHKNTHRTDKTTDKSDGKTVLCQR
jgi:hypothetical protein